MTLGRPVLVEDEPEKKGNSITCSVGEAGQALKVLGMKTNPTLLRPFFQSLCLSDNKL